MSDSKLRELERRWRETKSVEDEAAYLRERVRVGDLTQERLELAAYCGHEGARRAAEADRSPVPPGQLSNWIGELRERNSEVCLQALGLCASRLLVHFKRRHPHDTIQEPAIRAGFDCLRCPCESHTAEARRRARLARGSSAPAPFAYLFAEHAARGAGGKPPSGPLLITFCDWLAEAIGEPAALNVLKGDLSAWALMGPSG